MSNQDEAVKTAQALFKDTHLQHVGGGFYLYLEADYQTKISRKGLERCASEYVGKPLTLIVRNDVTDNKSEVARKLAGCDPTLYRSTVLQLSEDYERDQARSMEVKAKRLQDKFNK